MRATWQLAADSATVKPVKPALAMRIQRLSCCVSWHQSQASKSQGRQSSKQPQSANLELLVYDTHGGGGRKAVRQSKARVLAHLQVRSKLQLVDALKNFA